MKGPQFRSAVSPPTRCKILKACGVEQMFTVNVLEEA